MHDSPLPPSDKRRVFRGLVSLKAGHQLQKEIDALTADTETLTITPGDGFYDGANAVVLERCFLELTELQVINVCFSKIVLDETVPRCCST